MGMSRRTVEEHVEREEAEMRRTRPGDETQCDEIEMFQGMRVRQMQTQACATWRLCPSPHMWRRR